jgi:hypothetical protein
MLHGNTHVKLDLIKVNSNQNMLNFPRIDGMILPFRLAKVHNSQA